MATEPAQVDTKALGKEAIDRINDCTAQKRHFELDMREGYFFAAPHRSRTVSTSASPDTSKMQDAGELQISIAFEETENFSTTLINSFMPEGAPWVALEAGAEIDEVLKPEVEEQIRKDRDQVFKMVAQSNFYAGLTQALTPDASLGTFALWIDRERKGRSICCHAIPLRELEINIGPNGEVDDRFRVVHTKLRFLRTLINKAAVLPDALQKKIAAKPKDAVVLRMGFWRLWDRDDETWQYVEMVGNDVVYSAVLTGTGSCPLIVVRFNPYPEWAYGVGPLIKALPELRHLDDMAAGEVESVDLSLRPPMSYPDDSFANIEGGVVPGGFYPVRPGTAGDIRKMYEPNALDAVYFDQSQRERRVKRMFYNDFPEQRGDTPPTATQWLDEMEMAQRKIGTPGYVFWREGPRQFFLRFYFLAKQAGLVKPVTVNGAQISVAPYNPAQRAQNQQKVGNAVRAGQILGGLFPEEFKARIDGSATMDEVIKLMDVEDVLKKRSADDVKQAVDQISQLQGGGAPSFATVQPGQPGGPMA